jgi:hypothetical protein
MLVTTTRILYLIVFVCFAICLLGYMVFVDEVASCYINCLEYMINLIVHVHFGLFLLLRCLYLIKN